MLQLKMCDKMNSSIQHYIVYQIKLRFDIERNKDVVDRALSTILSPQLIYSFVDNGIPFVDRKHGMKSVWNKLKYHHNQEIIATCFQPSSLLTI